MINQARMIGNFYECYNSGKYENDWKKLVYLFFSPKKQKTDESDDEPMDATGDPDHSESRKENDDDGSE